MAGVLSRPLFRQHYQTGGGVSDLWERGRGIGGAALEYLMKQGLSLEEAVEQIKNNPRLIEALERGRGVAGATLERGRAAIDDPRVRATLERGRGMAGEALERGRGFMERLHGVPPGGFGAGSVNVPPGGFGAGSVNVPPGGFGGTNLPVPVQRSGLPVPTSSDVGFSRSFDKDHIDSFRSKAGRVARGLGRFAMNPYVAAASIAIPLAYDALTDSPEELLDQLDTQTRAYVEYLMEQGVSIEEALKIASPSEEAPLERQAGGPVQHLALGGLAALGGLLGAGVALKAAPLGVGLLGYHALTSSGRKQQEVLALLPPEQKAQVKALVDQGMSVEDALEAVDASAQEEAPLERQAGGPVMPPQAMMPPPQGMPPQAMMPPPQAAPAGMDALMGQAPQMLSRAEGAVATRMEDVGREYVNNTLSAVDRAEDPEELINAIRGTDVPIEQRYDELAQIVGEQDAEATPPSVLTLVQPALMMTEQGAVDSGIGNLMQELSSSAEMLTGEGEATPMGEGVGNLMMAGAQPAMEALPPGAMMGPPPGAMMGPPPGAMMGPPPGGMAYGGPIRRFAQGGMVNSAEELARLGRGPDTELVHMSPREVGALDTMARQNGLGGLPINPQTGLPEAGIFDQALGYIGKVGRQGLGYAGRFAAANPVSTALGAVGAGLYGAYNFADDPKFKRIFGIGGLPEINPITGIDYGALSGPQYVDPKDPRYDPGSSPAAIAAHARMASGRPFGSQIEIDAPQVSLDEAPQTTAAIIAAPGTIGFDYDFMREYHKEDRFKKSFADRLKLYEEALGSDKDFTKSQILFDIAGAGLAFAGGRGAGGENVATRSPAAQFAAAFSQVPKTIGERLARQRQEERGVKIAALGATEKEEAATRQAVSKERLTEADILASISTGEFNARNLFNIEGARFEQEANLSNANRILTRNIAVLENQTSLDAIKYRGQLESALAGINHQYRIIEDAESLKTGLKQTLIRSGTQLTNTAMALQARREGDIFAAQMANARQTRDLVFQTEIGQLTLDMKARHHEDLLDFRGLLKEQDQEQFDDRMKMEHLFRTSTTYTRDDLIEQAKLDRRLRAALGEANYNKFQTQLIESTRQFDLKYGLERAVGFGTLDYKNMVLEQESFEHLIENLGGGSFTSDAATKAERDRDILANRGLWKRYATGDLAPSDSSYVDAFITEMLTPQVNPQTGLTSTKILPRNAREAIRERQERGLPLPIQDPSYLLWEDVGDDFFGLREEKKQAAFETRDRFRILP